MENRIRRPASVWIAQILLIIFSLLFLLPLIMLLFVSAGIPSIIGLAIAAMINLGIVSLFLTAFVGMARRRQYGRWLGVGVLSLMLFFSILAQFVRPSGPLQYYEYENATEAAAGFMTQVLMCGLFLWLILALAFGKRATSFFTGKDTEGPLEIFPR